MEKMRDFIGAKKVQLTSSKSTVMQVIATSMTRSARHPQIDSTVVFQLSNYIGEGDGPLLIKI